MFFGATVDDDAVMNGESQAVRAASDQQQVDRVDREWLLSAEEYLRALQSGTPFDDRAKMLLEQKLEHSIGKETLKGRQRCHPLTWFHRMMDAYGCKGALLKVEWTEDEGVVVTRASFDMSSERIEVDAVLSSILIRKGVECFRCDSFAPATDQLVHKLFFGSDEPLDNRSMVLVSSGIAEEDELVHWISVGLARHPDQFLNTGVLTLIVKTATRSVELFFREQRKQERIESLMGQLNTLIQDQAEALNAAHWSARAHEEESVKKAQVLEQEVARERDKGRAGLTMFQAMVRAKLVDILAVIPRMVVEFARKALPKKGKGSQRLPRLLQSMCVAHIETPIADLIQACSSLPVNEEPKKCSIGVGMIVGYDDGGCCEEIRR